MYYIASSLIHKLMIKYKANYIVDLSHLEVYKFLRSKES